jgi:hypothetical protein
MATIAELEAAINDGCAVEVAGHPDPISGVGGLDPADTSRRRARAVRQLKKVTARLGDDVQGTVVRDSAGRLTHAGMKACIARGESVMFGDEIITTHADLPHPADLAAGNESKMAAVEADLDRREADLAVERKRVAAAREQAKEDAKAAQKAATAEEEEVKGAFAGMETEELQKLADDNNVTVEGRPTKKKLAAALASAGVTPPEK